MKYLLDVNALLAWRHANTAHHAAFHAWAGRVGTASLGTCAITELGFIRVSMLRFGYTLEEALRTMADMRRQTGGYLSDCPAPSLAAWANTAAKTTDAYLCQLASAHKLKLATFDAGIKDAAALLIA